jgi:WD40 repeat protein
MSSASFYVTGGTLRQDALSYIERRADRDLYAALQAGEFCYVLTSRQMGKSSLMVHTTVRLRKEGVAVAVLDLTMIGQNLSPEQWYDGLLSRLGRQLDLEEELEEYWEAHPKLGPLQRWLAALQDVVLPQRSGRVVVFVDEIDAVRSLPFSADEFFAGIRECYTRRAEDPDFERLTFGLFGVATPSDLIQDVRITPFNIGRRIELTDFTATEAAPLARGLGREGRIGRALLARVLYWTGGHPYLTQRLCRAVGEAAAVSTPGDVDRLCHELFLSKSAQEKDDNLLFVRERLLKSKGGSLPEGEVRAGLLDLYGKVRSGQRVGLDDTNQLVSILRLSGITRTVRGCLRVRNWIYERVFDRAWITQHMPDAELRRQRAAFRRGLWRMGTLASGIIAVIAALAISAVRLAEQRQAALIHSRLLLYAAQMNVAQQAWAAGDMERARSLLEAQRPRPRQEDLRGFEWRYLWPLCQHGSARRTLEAVPNQAVADWFVSFALSPDGRLLASEGSGHTVLLWDLATGRKVARFTAQRGLYAPLIFSPDGRLLATPSGGQTFRIWNIAPHGGPVRLVGPQDRVNTMAFSPDSRLLATGNVDRTIRLWDTATGRPVARLQEHTKPVSSVAFSPDGKLLASGSADRTIRLWDLDSRQERAVLHGHRGVVMELSFCRERRLLASRGWAEPVVRLWDTRTGQEAGLLRGHTAAIRCLAVSPDGKTMATGSDDSTIRLWDLASKRGIAVLQGHLSNVYSVEFSPDGRWLASGSDDGTVRLWNRASGRLVTTFRGHKGVVADVAFLPDGKSLVSSSQDGTVKLWDINLPAPAVLLGGDQKATGLEPPLGVNSVAFSRDGRALASASEDGSIGIWDLVRRREIVAFHGHVPFAKHVAFSPNGMILAAAREDGLKLWDVARRRERRTPQRQEGGVIAVAFTPDGKLLASGGRGQTIKFWDPVTGQVVATLRGHHGQIHSLAFSPDGRLLASAARDRLVKLWDVVSRREIASLPGHTQPVRAVAFSRGGKLLASAGNDQTVKLWDVSTQHCLSTLEGHAYKISEIAFSPDGKEFATSSEDGTIKLWNVAMRQEVGSLNGQGKSVISVAFSPDGNTLATGSADGKVRLWHASTFAETDSPASPSLRRLSH